MKTNATSELLKNQQAFFASGATREIAFRIEQMQKLAKAIEYREEEILLALKLDLGKSATEAYLSEAGMVKAELSYIIKNLRQWAKPKRVRTPLLFFGGKSQIYPEPLGQVLIISPWNYPFYLSIAPLLGAMAAGNCAVLKPSELAPHTSALLFKLIADNFAKDYIAVVEGGVESSQELLEQRFDHIFFTGGPMVWKIVMQAAARHLTPVTLELGGKSPCIVEKDINIEYAARRIIWGKYLNAGQTCVAPDYLLVNRQIKAVLLEKLQEVITQFYGPDPCKCSDYARIINERHFNRLEALLSDGQIICGGKIDREARYISPTIIDGVFEDSPVMQEEIFGPLLPVLEYEDLDE
ncbi:MAG: aldehyde dehydrogenase family protein, partial [Syntrophomonadaceae bacterium]|nr:aldehyde dehydrogenase family protein [Syntrophomonadaceae bacterium]